MANRLQFQTDLIRDHFSSFSGSHKQFFLNKMFLVLITLISCVLANRGPVTVEESFQCSELVPEVISEGPPKELLVTYGNGVVVERNQHLWPTQVKDQPEVEFRGAWGSSYYTLIMIDPDAPIRTRPTLREFKHWLVVNIAGNDLRTGDTLAEYIGAGPANGSRWHRYAILLYKQPRWLYFDEERVSKKSLKNRANFSTRKFARKYNLGKAVAGTFFYSTYDSYVPKLEAQLSGN